MLSEGKKKKNKNWSILMSSQDKTLLLCPVISSHGDPVSALYKYIYYFQFLVFEIIRFVGWFYVPDGTFPHLWKSSVFVSQDFFLKLLKLLFSRVYYVTVALWILITALFLICTSRSMFVQSQLCSFSSVNLWKCIHCLYVLGMRFFVWKVIIDQGSLIFTIPSRISFHVYSEIFTIYSIYHLCLFLNLIFVIIFRSNLLVHWESSFQWVISLCHLLFKLNHLLINF